MSKFTYSVEKVYTTLSTSSKGWNKQLTSVSWNGLAPKYDIREWDPEHAKMGKGITLSEAELRSLYETLKELYGDGETPTIATTVSLTEKLVALQTYAPLFVQELTQLIRHMHEIGFTNEQIKEAFLATNQTPLAENIVNEIESLESIYAARYEEFKAALQHCEPSELQMFFS